MSRGQQNPLHSMGPPPAGQESELVAQKRDLRDRATGKGLSLFQTKEGSQAPRMFCSVLMEPLSLTI